MNTKRKSFKPAWGEECKDFKYVMVPIALIRLPRYAPDSKLTSKLKPNHYRLLLCLASYTNKRGPIAPHWERLAHDLGLKVNSTRKLGYELRDLGLLGIRNRRGRPKGAGPGVRNESNVFDLTPFVKALLVPAGKKREAERLAKRLKWKNSHE